MTNVYPRWFPTENGPVSVDYDRSTVNFPYISLSIIVLSGVLSPFLLLIIVHPLIDFIVGGLLYSLALGLAVRLAYRLFGKKPLTVVVKDKAIVVKYLFKKKAIRPDNIESVDWADVNITQIQQAVATIHISTSRKPVVLYFGSFTNSASLLKQLLMICGLKSLTVPAPISAFTHEETPAVSDYKESTAGVREALYRKLS